MVVYDSPFTPALSCFPDIARLRSTSFLRVLIRSFFANRVIIFDFDLTISEIRINSTGKLYLENTTITTEGDVNGGKLTTFQAQLSVTELYRDSLLSELEQSNSTSESDNLTQLLSEANSSILFLSNNINAFTTYTLVSDAGNLSIYDSTIYYGMIWLVGGNAEITGLALDGFSKTNYGIFSEDTNLKLSGVSIRNYTLGLRSIGSNPDIESIFYYNCGTQMTQEWWVTFSAFEESTGSPILGFEPRQWDGERMVGSWNWAKQYEINSSGQIIDHQASFTFYLNLGLEFGYVERSWEGYIDNNLDIVENFNLNHTHVAFESGTIFVDGTPYVIGERAPKFSEVNLSVSIVNPTDINFNNLNLDLLINAKSGYVTERILLPSNSSITTNVTWNASKEGPLSLAVNTTIVDYSDNSTEDYTITLNRFIEIESGDSFTKSEGSWTALLAIIILMSLCSYIIYTGMEDESEVVDSESSDEDVEEKGN